MRSTKEHYERANVVAPQIEVATGIRAWLLKSMVYLALFGLVGGAAGVGVAEMISTRPDRAEEAAQWMADLRTTDHQEAIGKYKPDEAKHVRERIRAKGQRNAAFVRADIAAYGAAAKLATPNEAAARAVEAADRAAESQANLIAFAAAGLLIAAALAAADRIIERDTPAALIDGGIAGAIGAACGAGVALLLPSIASFLPQQLSADTTSVPPIAVVAALVLFGAAVGAAPGIVIRNARRATAGIAGGLVGGVVGAVLLLAISKFLAADIFSRIVAFAVVGAAIGVTMGWLEEAAKQGWLRVASGLIAGKQFILYRNPTFVGSAPMSHIYLFRDPQVGRRHAAIFLVTGGGYEIENLPLGGPTLVNGQPVSRVRLKRGDRIGIGRTTLVFDEKVAS